MDYVVPLIDEAWDHRRRRRRWTYLTGAAALVLVAVVVFLAPSSPRPGPQPATGFPVPRGTVRISPTTAFSQPPYMGVNCPVANSIACDQVGLAVWLRRPAHSVKARMAGAYLPLDWFGDEHRIGDRRLRRAFDGYLRPAGIVSRLHVRASGSMWYGDGNPSPMVWLLIDYGQGHYAVTHLRVPLNTGWS